MTPMAWPAIIGPLVLMELKHSKPMIERRPKSWSIETKFSKALYLQESIKLYSTALEQNKTFAQMAKKKKTSGLASDADVIEFDLNEAILRSDLEEIKSEYNEAIDKGRLEIR